MGGIGEGPSGTGLSGEQAASIPIKSSDEGIRMVPSYQFRYTGIADKDDMMKITFNIDCTPEEARAFFGLPDVSPINEMIVSGMLKRTQENLDSLTDPKAFWDRAMAAGSGNMEAFNKLFAAGMAASSKATKD